MERVNQILNHVTYGKAMEKNNAWEQNRMFCKHGLTHQLDVGRIAYILSLEMGLGIKKDIIYAIALLHDIGKYMQYEKKVPHNEASCQLAENILIDCGYIEEERTKILKAILNHREKSNNESQLDGIIYKADKLSRNCFVCRAKDSCDWSDEKKNRGITW